MKPFILCILLSFGTLSMSGQNLILKIENIKHPGGQLLITLFSSSEDFLKNPCYTKFLGLTDQKEMTVTLDDVPDGTYALCVVHDSNNNGTIDTNIFKIPVEAYGFSGNTRGLFGPPKYDKVKFNFRDSLELKVVLN